MEILLNRLCRFETSDDGNENRITSTFCSFCDEKPKIGQSLIRLVIIFGMQNHKKQFNQFCCCFLPRMSMGKNFVLKLWSNAARCATPLSVGSVRKVSFVFAWLYCQRSRQSTIASWNGISFWTLDKNIFTSLCRIEIILLSDTEHVTSITKISRKEEEEEEEEEEERKNSFAIHWTTNGGVCLQFRYRARTLH